MTDSAGHKPEKNPSTSGPDGGGGAGPPPASPTRSAPARPPQASRSPIALFRRRVLPWAGRLWAALGLLVLGGWLTGRILTDEYLWSQYLSWMPTLWVLGASVVCWVCSWLSGLLATRMSGDLLRPVLGVGILLAAGWMLVAEWRVYRIVRLPVDTSQPSLRVAFWNCSSKAHLEGAETDLESISADLTVIANPTSGPNQLRGLLEAMGRVTGAPAERGAGEPDEALGEGGGPLPVTAGLGVHLVRRYGLIIASRLPIVGYGDAWLEESEGGDEDWRTAGYGGRAVFAELDASELFPDLGRPLVVWVIDLPSDPSLHKREPARRARAAIESFEGPVLRPSASGVLTQSGAVYPGFPSPDVVVGDFNSPRGAGSLKTIVGVMGSAHDQGGFGPDVTWDQPLAWWAIDLMFVGTSFRARRFDARLLRHHAHSVIVGEIVSD